MAETVGSEKSPEEELNEAANIDDNSVIPDAASEEKSEQTLEIERLRDELTSKQNQINRYDGERKDLSEKMNILETQISEMSQKHEEEITDDDEYEPVTKAELKDYKSKEIERFRNFQNTQIEANRRYLEEYNKSVGESSMSVDNDDVFNAISREHDLLVSTHSMPESTGNAIVDGRIGWSEAERSYLRKMNAAGKQIPFNKTPSTKPVQPGSGNLNTSTVKTSQAMPEMSADAQQLMDDLGESGNADFANKALNKQ
jgi:chromosome segregation ATPase|tara:strand:- start:7600 stop:8370 length:771 start_codon:yes stop_codon:yes gene_type:complete